MQGALWVYEALLAPGLKQARVELSKFPAIENAFKQLHGQPQKVQVSRAAKKGSDALEIWNG